MIYSDVRRSLKQSRLYDRHSSDYPCMSPVYVIGVPSPMRCSKCPNCLCLRRIVFGDSR